MRLLEWKERKRMGKEEDMMRVKVTAEEKKMIVEEEIEKVPKEQAPSPSDPENQGEEVDPTMEEVVQEDEC